MIILQNQKVRKCGLFHAEHASANLISFSLFLAEHTTIHAGKQQAALSVQYWLQEKACHWGNLLRKALVSAFLTQVGYMLHYLHPFFLGNLAVVEINVYTVQ